jgi:multicomponent Na+:H+ antiporter subunit B
MLMITVFEYTIVTAIIIAALNVVVTPSVISSTISLSAFSILVTIWYLINHAPDVAITEAAVGALLSTLLILATNNKVKHKISEYKGGDLRALAILFLVTIPFVLCCQKLSAITAQGLNQIGQYYIENTGREIGITEVVTAILASYRAYDTLGEVTVVLLAGIGVTAVLRKST